jgi:general secretion pathway protein E/type IV pilus assembly protein PilB
MVSLEGFRFDSIWGEQYSRAFMMNRGALKLAETEEEVTVAVVKGSAAELRYFLEGYHLPKTVKFEEAARADFAAYIGSTTEYTGTGIAAGGGFVLDTVEQDAPVINMINGLCIEAIKRGASDIHIEAQREGIDIRYRIDGVLRLVKKLEGAVFQQISNRVKVMASLNTMELRLPQDGRMTVTIEGKRRDLRVSIVPVADGESIVLRLFGEAGEGLTLQELGFADEDREVLQRAVRQPHGLVMLSGPTGSGKTTTLHALLGTLAVQERKIITIEDPVEQYVRGINQIQVNEGIGLTFEGMLRRVLRQDPDVIMVGEIRDRATAELAVRAALTGHLILSTVHTNDSVGIIPRLADMGIAPYLIAGTLRCGAAQRLVRRICKSCGGKGCDICTGSGYRGRTVIGEVFEVDGELRRMIGAGTNVEEIRKYTAKNGMKGLAERGKEKIRKGITTREELEREALV